MHRTIYKGANFEGARPDIEPFIRGITLRFLDQALNLYKGANLEGSMPDIEPLQGGIHRIFTMKLTLGVLDQA